MALITVRAARSDKRVLLWERDPRHPDGEAWISADGGAQTHEVWATGAVQVLLAAGLLVAVAPAPAPTPPAPDSPPPVPTPRAPRSPKARTKSR